MYGRRVRGDFGGVIRNYHEPNLQSFKTITKIVNVVTFSRRMSRFVIVR